MRKVPTSTHVAAAALTYGVPISQAATEAADLALVIPTLDSKWAAAKNTIDEASSTDGPHLMKK